MFFTSDNAAGVHPDILAAVARAGAGPAMAYGADPLTAGVEARIREVFEAPEARAYLVATGTAADALALACLCPPWATVYAHNGSHIENDECASPEFFTGGAKLTLLDGDDARIDEAELAGKIRNATLHGVHNVQNGALSITQATESGALYSLDQIARLSAIAHKADMGVHMDGARFANALVTLGCGPADATWRAGIDVLSFGATKNGALAAEAVIFFRPELAHEFGERRKRGGHLLSKLRFISAQLDAYLSDDLWLRNARAANRAAARLADGLSAIAGVRLVYPVEANEVFAVLPDAVIGALEGDGFGFYRMGGAEVIRLVASFNTSEADVDAFLTAARRHAET